MQYQDGIIRDDLPSGDPARITRILDEFSNGFEVLSKIGPAVSIFCSDRVKSDNRFYNIAYDVAKKLVEKDYGIITGGGFGIVEAANKWAKEGKGKSVSLNIMLPVEQEPNSYIDTLQILQGGL